MPMEDIPFAIQEHIMLEITYMNQKGETSTRTVEPYEIKDGYFFAWDIAKDGIRCFFLSPSVLLDVKLLETRFIPRF